MRLPLRSLGPWLLLLALALRPPPRELRVTRVVLVDERGSEVGHLAVREHGAELVLGGDHQASLVTDASGAHLNLVGPDALVRLGAAEAPVVVRSDLGGHDDVGPSEPADRAPGGGLSPAERQGP